MTVSPEISEETVMIKISFFQGKNLYLADFSKFLPRKSVMLHIWKNLPPNSLKHLGKVCLLMQFRLFRREDLYFAEFSGVEIRGRN